MGKPTYDELTKLYKDSEMQKENLLLENEELKGRLNEAVRYIKEFTPITMRSGKTYTSIWLNKMLNILRGIDND